MQRPQAKNLSFTSNPMLNLKLFFIALKYKTAANQKYREAKIKLKMNFGRKYFPYKI
jgi:hypothetical protein